MKIKIDIEGDIKGGRSTVAKYIETCLNAVGFDGTLDDEENTVEWLQQQPERLKAVVDKQPEITITTSLAPKK